MGRMGGVYRRMWGRVGRVGWNVGGLIEGCRESRRSDYGDVEMAITGMGAHDGG